MIGTTRFVLECVLLAVIVLTGVVMPAGAAYTVVSAQAGRYTRSGAAITVMMATVMTLLALCGAIAHLNTIGLGRLGLSTGILQ